MNVDARFVIERVDFPGLFWGGRRAPLSTHDTGDVWVARDAGGFHAGVCRLTKGEAENIATGLRNRGKDVRVVDA